MALVTGTEKENLAMEGINISQEDGKEWQKKL